jgi:hypothetical protein
MIRKPFIMKYGPSTLSYQVERPCAEVQLDMAALHLMF